MTFHSRSPLNNASPQKSSPPPRHGRNQLRSSSSSSSERLSQESPSPRSSGVHRGDDSPSHLRHDDWNQNEYSLDRSISSGHSTKIVVERLTKNVNQEHLLEIFGKFGTIQDLDLPISRISGVNRGTAYILYKDELNAESAISHMHEAQLDGSTIKVSIVLSRHGFLSPPPLARRGTNSNSRKPAQATANHANGRRSPARFANARALDTYRPRSISRSRSRTPPSDQRTRQYCRSVRSHESRSPTPPFYEFQRDNTARKRAETIEETDRSEGKGTCAGGHVDSPRRSISRYQHERTLSRSKSRDSGRDSNSG